MAWCFATLIFEGLGLSAFGVRLRVLGFWVLGFGFRGRASGLGVCGSNSESPYPLIGEYTLNHSIKAPII